MKKSQPLEQKPAYPGRLIVVEGTDGSGKSTQLHLLSVWLKSKGYRVFVTEWNSSALVKYWTKKAKKAKLLTPTTFSLIHASDFFDRYEKMVLPLLRAGYIVLADRYIYTAFARDVTRGCDRGWVRNTYRMVVPPTLALYFQTPIEIAVERVLAGRGELNFHEAGMDLGLSQDPVESFKIFQGRVKDEYDAMVQSENLVIINGANSVEDQQQLVRKLVTKALKTYNSVSVPAARNVKERRKPS